MYEVGQHATWDLFDEFLEGNPHGIVAVIGMRQLAEAARTACQNSMSALGYGKGACTFVCLQPDGQSERLDPAAVRALLEGLDPLCIIVADAESAAVMAQAYEQSIALDRPNRILGRDVAAFRNLSALMDTPQNKQRAWALFKTLPRFGEFNRKKA